MGTRSCIAVPTSNGYRSVYCHWDGSPTHNGAILAEHYNRAKTEKLLSMGDLSSLGRTIGRKHNFDKRPEGSKVCTFYKRDRGDTNVEARDSASFAELAAAADQCGAEFLYMLIGRQWHYAAVPCTTIRDLKPIDLAGLKRVARAEKLECFERYAEGLATIDTPIAGSLRYGEPFSRRYDAPTSGLSKDHYDWLESLEEYGFAWTFDKRRHSLRLDHPGDKRVALRASAR